MFIYSNSLKELINICPVSIQFEKPIVIAEPTSQFGWKDFIKVCKTYDKNDKCLIIDTITE